MVKTNRSISIDNTILNDGEKQAKKERRSFSSLVEYLLDKYLTALKKTKSASKK